MFTFIKKVIAFSLAITMTFLPTASYALPTGENVVHGSATFDRSTSNHLDVTTGGAKTIIEYNNHNIAGNESVHYQQPNASAITLSRVVGVDPTAIYGDLSSNGQLWLINPNGITFDGNALVDTAGLVASTLDIANQDFIDGNYHFTGQGGTVWNDAVIRSPGGYVALLGEHVKNTCLVEANYGTVALASGEAITLSLDGDSLINVVVDQGVSTNGSGADSAILNKHTLRANGGKVLLTTDILNDVFDNAINNRGVIEAKSFVNADGYVGLIADVEDDHIRHSGEIRVQGAESGANGGTAEFQASTMEFVNNKIYAQPSSGGDVGHLIFRSKDFSINDAWEERFEDYNGADITIEGTRHVTSNLSDNELNLENFDIEKLTIHAVENVNQNGDKILTDGGDVEILADNGNITLNAKISTSGGDVDVEATSGEVDQWSASDVFTSGGDFRGYAGANYELHDGSYIETKAGNIDIVAENNITMGDAAAGGDGNRLRSNNDIFLTAKNGAITQHDGNIKSKNLHMEADHGITGEGVNDGVEVSIVHYLSAVNHETGDIRVADTSHLAVADLSGLTGLNDDIEGFNGVTNHAEGGRIDLYAKWDLYVDAPVTGHGDIHFETQVGNVELKNAGDVTIIQNVDTAGLGITARSTSHTPEVWSNDPTIDVEWELTGEIVDGYEFTADVGCDFIMDDDTTVDTNNGDITIDSFRHVKITMLDAGLADVSITSETGDIIDNDKSIVPADYDILARRISMSAPNGDIGAPGGAEDQIDIGAPLEFSHLFDETSDTTPDNSVDAYTQELQADGEWLYKTSYTVPHDSDSWYFHVAGVDPVAGIKLTSTEHLGPFYIDTTAPVIFADYADANAFGWHNTDVTVDFHATDNLSGFAPDGSLATDLNSETVTTEGIGLIVTSDGIFDRAGNAAEIIDVSLNIDKTKPVITSVDVPDANEHGWYNEDVTVDFSATDNLSGFAPDGSLSTDLLSQTSTGEGIGLIISSDGVVMDMAGNVADHIEVAVNVDKTAPVISADYIDANGFGWHNTDVTVDFSATDNLSGFAPDGSLATDLNSETVTTEGIGLIVTSDGIFDLAGNEATPLDVTLNIDKTKPVITAVDVPDANEHGWYNEDVTVDFAATDNLSGFAPDGSLSTDLLSQTSTGEGLGLIISSDGVVMDMAGNVADPVEVAVNVDKTAPVITADYIDPNAFGWHNTDVTVDFNATDNLSGFAPDGSLATNVNSETVTTEGIGLIITSDGITDLAGNPATPINVALNIDKTPPTITPGTPIGELNPDGTFLPDVTVPFSATDNLSGFEPTGDLFTDMDPKTSSGLGNVIVTSDGIFDMAGNFAPGVPVPLLITIPGGNPNPEIPLTFEYLEDEFRVYYEILDPSQFTNFDPATKIGLYAYHPILETDQSAFDDIELDIDAYQYIEEEIEYKKKLNPYFGG